MARGGRRRIGQRYELFGAMAAGGTATVHLGRLHGTAGFVKPIAIKRLHPHLAADPALRTILVEEARLVSRISHPNVVAVLDIVEDDGELFLVLEYVHGATLAELTRAGERCEPATAVAVMRDVLTGLHAAHHARDASGALLGLVHRDVSPRNVIVTTGGIGKILDFGIAKARARQSNTRDGHVRGSLPYMAPEQLADEPLTARTDVYGVAVVLWEALTGVRLFTGDTEASIVKRILDHDVQAPSTVVPDLPRALDAVVLRGLARDPEQRFSSGLEMALALEESLAPSRPEVVATWVARSAEQELARRQALLDGGEGEGAAAVGEGDAPRVAAVGGGERNEGAGQAAPRPASSARLGMVVGVIAVGIGVARVVMGGGGGSGGETGAGTGTGTGTGTTGTSASASASASADTGTATTATTTATTTAATDAGTGAGTAVDAGAGTKPTGAGAVAAVTRATPSASASARADAGAGNADCPPYFVDSAGVRRFNRECLK